MNDVKEADNTRIPAGVHNAFFFASFNALSFQIVLSSPMILFAKGLGASATTLGIIVGMMPLLVVFQIPAANYIPRIGYRRFVLSGWSIRVLFIFLMALLPLTRSILPERAQVALLLFLLFAFNLFRGISSCAWLPWLTALLPASARGHYLVREASFVNVSSFLVLLFSAWALGPAPEPWRFAILFGFSALAGAVSLWFLKRIPDVPVPVVPSGGKGIPPWGAILSYPPFKKLLLFNVVWHLAYGGIGAFAVAFLKTETPMTDQGILMTVSASFIGGLVSLWFLGSRVDRLGSKPIVALALLFWIGIAALWVMLSGKALSPNRPVIFLAQLFMGLGAALVQMANTRLAMTIIPEMGRSHFFAAFSVVGSLSLGIAPIVWGILIDGLRPLQTQWAGIELNRYSVFFLCSGLMFLLSLVFCRRLEEPDARPLESLLKELFIEAPQKVWVRLWPRF